MEYKLYLSGTSYLLKQYFFHKNNLEETLNYLKKRHEYQKEIKEDFISDILNVKFEDKIEEEKYFELEDLKIIVFDTNNNLIEEIDMSTIINNKTVLSKHKSKENSTVFEKIYRNKEDQLFLGSVNSSYFDKTKLLITNIIINNNSLLINKIEYNSINIFFIKNIELSKNKLLNKNFFIKKYNKKGFQLLLIYDYKLNFFFADILINKYKEDNIFFIDSDILQIYMCLNKHEFLTIEETIKDYFLNYDIKNYVQDMFGLEIDLITINIKDENNKLELDLNDLNTIKLKLLNKEFCFIKLNIFFKENLKINKGIFINKISSIFHKNINYIASSYNNDSKIIFSFNESNLISIEEVRS